MPTGAFQRSFAGGEVSPAISARADVIKRATAAQTMKNGFAARTGAYLNRAGTKFVNEVKDSTQETTADILTGVPETLIPFIFNSTQAYVLEFGEQYIRIHRFGQPLFLSPATYSAAINYTPGDTVYDGTSDYWYCTQNNGPASTVSAPAAGAYWYQLPELPSWYSGDKTTMLEIPTPYAAGEITKQNVAQSADVLSIAHKNHVPRELQRLSATKWQLGEVASLPEIESPAGLTSSATFGAGPVDYHYKVTAIRKDTYEESVVAHVTSGTTSTVTSAGDNDVVITVGHSLASGDEVYISAVTPSSDENSVLVSALEKRSFFITDIGPGTGFSLDDTAGIPYSFAHDVTWHETTTTTGGVLNLSKSRNIFIEWDEVDDSIEYYVYKTHHGDTGIYGFIGSTRKTEFKDTGIEPDFESTPPQYGSRFERDDKHPHTVSYFQQRLCYGQSIEEPQGVWMSRSSNFHNFSIRSPLQDSDPVVFSISGERVNEVRHLVGLDQLVVLTLGNQHAVSGDQDGVVRPDAINLRTQGYNGSSEVSPVTIGGELIYVQARGSIVRSLGFDALREGYEGVDVSIYASHLLDGLEIYDMAYAQVPFSIVWAVLSNGQLLGMTYIREHEIAGWHWHVTYTSDGTVASEVKSIAVIPEDGVDILYMVVERVINGSSVRYVEKMVRRCTSWSDA